MARLSEDKINEIRTRSDIVEVISKYMPLSKKGKNFVGNCPFHNDHDPSLTVSQEKQIFKCFACGTGGNVFQFVSAYENISFVESVLEVAKISNIEVFDIDVPVSQQNPKLIPYYKINQAFIDYTSYILKSNAYNNIVEYLHNRGIHDELIKKFEIGYNPSDDALYHYLKAKKFNEEEMINANIVRLTSSGIHDVFATRITIPIHDKYGNPIAFTARKTIESDEAKYINTTETACYVKGNVIFNYHRALPIAKKTGRVLLVEGAMDTIAFYKANIENVVATLGTACTNEQLKLLKQMHVKIDVCYDGDNAGINATYKFGKLASEMGLDFEIVDNKSGLDPDEIIEKYGIEELKALSQKTISWIDFCFEYLQRKYHLENYSQKVDFAKEMKIEIDRVEESFLKENYFKRLYDLTQFDMSKSIQTTQYEKRYVNRTHFKFGELAEYEILGQMLLSKQAVNIFKNDLGFLINPTCNSLSLYLINEYRRVDKIHVADLLSQIKENEVKDLLIDICEWELAPKEFNIQVFNDAITIIHNKCIESKIKEMTELSMKMSNPLDKARIMNEIFELKRKISQNKVS